jgi:hypothetical protein
MLTYNAWVGGCGTNNERTGMCVVCFNKESFQNLLLLGPELDFEWGG